MVEFETEFTEIIRRTDSVKSFRFLPLQKADFQAGQYFFITIKVGAKDASKPFSISSSPTEKDHLEFTKRITQSEFSRALDNMQSGDWVRVKLPYGQFTYNPEYKKIAFLSGGIGITPIRSICKSVADRKLNTDIILLYGNDREKDIIFREDLDNIAGASKNIRVVYTLTAKDIDQNAWPGRTGYIDEKMIKEEVPDYQERTFYVCGPPKMVESLIDILQSKLGLTKDRIIRENFAGYN